MAPRTKFVAPDLSNATPEMLADEMGKLSVMESQVKKLRALYKEVYYARTGINPDEKMAEPFSLSGETFIASTSQSTTRRLDQKLLQEKHPDIFEQCKGESLVTTTRFALKEGIENPVVNDLLNQLKQELDLD